MSDKSTYLKPSSFLDADERFDVSDTVRIEPYSQAMADNLGEVLLRRNVFSRHSWEKAFYVERARGLANETVIVIRQPGDPADIVEDAKSIASLIEKLLVLSALLGHKRPEVQRRLGIGRTVTSEKYLAMSADFAYVKSQQTTKPITKGITVDSRFQRRFLDCGFKNLFDSILTGTSKVAERLERSVTWLFDSVLDHRLDAAFVKSAISLESLLVLSDSESLAQSLAERSAFLLSEIREQREDISRAIKRFYDARSGIVHGGKKRLKQVQPSLIEGVDRLIIILWLALAHNPTTFEDDDCIRKWCDRQRWGEPERMLPENFPKSYLKNALRLCFK